MVLDRRAELRNMFNKVVEKQDSIRRVEFIKKLDEPISTFMPIKTKPFKHQVKAFAVTTALNASALLLEQGCGKTLVAIAAAGHRYIGKKIKRVLIVAPLSVLPVWERQFEQHADFPFMVTILNEGSGADKALIVDELRKAADPVLQVIVVNYDVIWRSPIDKALEKFVKHDCLIILDESQRIKNRGTEAAKTCRALGKLTPYKMILTGTPVSQSPADFFSQYRFLDHDIFGDSYTKFQREYLDMGGFGNHEILGYHNLEQLAAKAHSIAYRCTKADCLDLPPTIYQTEYVFLNESTDIYDTMERDFIVSLDDGTNVQAPVILAQILRLQQIVGGFLPIHDENDPTKILEYRQIGTEKMDLLKEIVEGLPDGQKVVIFTKFKPELRAIEDMLFKMGKGVLTLSGETPADRRGKICDTFQNDPGCNAIVVNIQTGGSGIDLYAASTAIFYSMDYSYINYAQACARLHRIGQTADHVTYLHLIAKGTIDEQIYEAVSRKGDVAQLVVDKMKGKYV